MTQSSTYTEGPLSSPLELKLNLILFIYCRNSKILILKRRPHFLGEMIVDIRRSDSIFEKFFCEFWLTQIERAVQRMVAAAFSVVKVISLIEFIISNHMNSDSDRIKIENQSNRKELKECLKITGESIWNQDLKVTWAMGLIAESCYY